MGYSSHSTEKLGRPFLMADEVVLVIPKGGFLRLERHHFKILFILEGSLEHEIEGIEGRRPLETGDILISPVVAEHTYFNPNPSKPVPLHTMRIFLDAGFLQKRARTKNRNPEGDIGDFIVDYFDEVSQIRGGIDASITELINSFRKEAEAGAAGCQIRLRSICCDLIVLAARKLAGLRGQPAPRPHVAHDQIVTAAKEFIFKHFTRDIKLGEVAWHVGKGEEHLARVFKRDTGQSVFEYVREMRINHAKTLLLNPALTLTQIARLSGFHSLHFFSRTFHKHEGVSASRYRREMATAARPDTGPRREVSALPDFPSGS